MIAEKAYWDNVYRGRDKNEIVSDGWLSMFELNFRQRSKVLDLGCGSGNNIEFMTDLGWSVYCCDLSEEAVENIKKYFPDVMQVLCIDIKEGLPYPEGFFDIVIADLSLHYFTETDTMKIINEIKRVLGKDGILLFRLNSVNDINYGAGQGIEIEQNYFVTYNGQRKRFFTERDISKFFSEWQQLSLNEASLKRYSKPKEVYIGAYRVIK